MTASFAEIPVTAEQLGAVLAGLAATVPDYKLRDVRFHNATPATKDEPARDSFIRIPEAWAAAASTAIAASATPSRVAAYVEASRLAAVRARRNAALAASDWTQLADAKVDTAAWKAYRQALRDLPSAPAGTPFPTPPQ